jgi:WD40 repeat protein
MKAKFSAEGRCLATVGESRAVRVWDTRTGKLLGPPLRHEAPVSALAASRDGKRVVLGTIGSCQMWEVESGKRIGPTLGYSGAFDAVFGRDDNTVLVGSSDGVNLWHVAPVAGDPARVILWAEVLAGLELDVNGLPHALTFEERNQRRRKLAELGGPPWP